jgi:hypothetical protein
MKVKYDKEQDILSIFHLAMSRYLKVMRTKKV